MRRNAFLALIAALTVLAQTQTPPAFEVASVKPTQHGRNADGWSRSSVDIPSPDRLVAENSSLDELIRFAYDLKDYQVSGPVWLNDDSESFDIVAKAPPGYSKDQVRVMLQVLLMGRFKLAAHRETKVLPIYELVVGKNGPKLKGAAPASRKGTSSGGGKLTATKVTMADFAYELSRQLNRPVLDKTEIAGVFDITLRYAREDDGASIDPPLFTAIQDTLGLKMEAAKGPIEILVIDHIEKAPTEN
jgi:uncharacterized protein (TIGR03435 family)